MPKLTEEKKALVDQFIRDKVYTQAKKLLQLHRVNLFTMTELADQMGVAKGTLYNYFEDKQTVIVYVYKRINEELLEQIIIHVDQHPQDYVDNLRYIYRTYIEGIKLNQFMDIAAITLQYDLLKKGDAPNVANKIYESIVQKNRQFLLEFLRKGQQAGVFKDCSLEGMAAFISMHFWGVKAFCMVQKTDMFNSSHMQKIIDDAENLLLEAVCKPEAAKLSKDAYNGARSEQ